MCAAHLAYGALDKLVRVLYKETCRKHRLAAVELQRLDKRPDGLVDAPWKRVGAKRQLVAWALRGGGDAGKSTGDGCRHNFRCDGQQTRRDSPQCCYPFKRTLEGTWAPAGDGDDALQREMNQPTGEARSCPAIEDEVDSSNKLDVKGLRDAVSGPARW